MERQFSRISFFLPISLSFLAVRYQRQTVVSASRPPFSFLFPSPVTFKTPSVSCPVWSALPALIIFCKRNAQESLVFYYESLLLVFPSKKNTHNCFFPVVLLFHTFDLFVARYSACRPIGLSLSFRLRLLYNRYRLTH